MDVLDKHIGMTDVK